MSDQQIAAGLEPVDALEVVVVVDNVTDNLSSVPHFVQHEREYLRHRGMKTLAGECLCCGAWGLSLVLTARRGGKTRSLLFDAGPDGAVFERNSLRLQIDFAAIDAVVLSHGHFDHAAGLERAFQFITAAKQGGATPLYVNKGMFRRRGMRLPDDSVLPLKDLPSISALEEMGAETVDANGAALLLDRQFWLSGEIPRVTPYEKGLPNHVSRTDAGDWGPDPWIMDERFLAVNVEGKGLVVFSACSHAGIVNVMTEARARFGELPIYAVMGGLHLSGAAVEKIIPETVTDLADFGIARIVPGHCTGWRAVNALVAAFGEAVVDPCAVGRLYRF